MKPYYQDDYAKIYHTDCREILPMLDKVDLVLTDPPYGVNIDYKSFEDTPENLEKIIIPIISECVLKFKRVVLTPGNKFAWKYPKPNDIGVWFNPAGTGYGSWGFNLAHLILYYGKDPTPNKKASSVTGFFERNENGVGHPVPKPEAFMKWLVDRASLPNETILDPFMGSGTTLRAAKDLGRKSIGIEIEEKYCEIAVRRLSQEVFDFNK